MRQVFKLAESIAPAILWCDEIEKGMSGSKGSSSSDGGTTSRVLGSWLTWMQEKTAPVFVVATANDISQLPAEMLRKGRFDEIFFVDLPEYEERKTIFEIHLNKRNRNVSKFDISELAEISEGFTGAEIEAAIVSALYESFSDSMRDLNNDDIIYALKETVPISVTMQETIEGLRDWASNRARNASKKISKKVKPSDTIIQEEEDL
jgi:SpoVK/Ycf46/Vps4 family AAA+-type ATPase